jgi:hypothetical protein
MRMADNGSVGQNMTMQKDSLVDDEQSHQSKDQISDRFFSRMLNVQLHHAAKVIRFLTTEIPNYGDICGKSGSS